MLKKNKMISSKPIEATSARIIDQEYLVIEVLIGLR